MYDNPIGRPVLDSAGIEPSSRTRQLAVALAALVVVAILAWYWETAASIVAIWYRSETFAHGFVVLPIVGWLIWRDRARLATVPIRPCWLALVPLAVVGFGWLVAGLGSVLGGTHFMVVAMVPLSIGAILGTRMLRALAFPLGFLFFAVPFGDFVVPTLIDWTANFTVWAVAASGVPVFREGNAFIVPSGRWSVVEACSGVRYLIASVVVGALYAYLTYRSWMRRALFVAVSILVPLVANWLRAYMIVMIGHLSSNRLAVGVDHIIYGWVFFGVVMLLLFWVAGRWREDGEPPAPTLARSAGSAVAVPTARLAGIAVATFMVAVAWRPLYAVLDADVSTEQVKLRRLAPANGWLAAPEVDLHFKPHYVNPAAEAIEHFTRGNVRVGSYVAFYRGQSQRSELVGYHNQLVTSMDSDWNRLGTGQVDVPLGAEPVRMRSTLLRGRDGDLLAWQAYWIDGRMTTSDAVAKVQLALARLRGRGDDAAVIVLFTPAGSPSAAAQALASFSRDLGADLQKRFVETQRR